MLLNILLFVKILDSQPCPPSYKWIGNVASFYFSLLRLPGSQAVIITELVMEVKPRPKNVKHAALYVLSLSLGGLHYCIPTVIAANHSRLFSLSHMQEHDPNTLGQISSVTRKLCYQQATYNVRSISAVFNKYEKQGLCRTRKLRQWTNWKENLWICQLAKASNKKLVCPAGPFRWSV